MSTSSATHRTYSFGEFTLDLDRGALLKAGADIKLRPKSFEVLSYLLEHHGRLVSKDELLDAIWGRTVVSEDAVNQCVTDIRRALHDHSQKIIRTVPRRGYIFDVSVTEHGGPVKASDRPSRSITLKVFLSLLCAAVILFAYDKWWMPEPPQRSIAVLPFENMSGDPEQEYFSDGVSEELLNLLAQIPELKVISRSSAFSFKGKDVAIPTVAEQLNVAHVLEGSVRKVGNRVRITAQLIEASSDSNLWSESYDRELDDIFAIQDEIAAAVVDALKIKLLGDELRSTEINPEAYALYLQGRHVLYLFNEESMKRAEILLKQALAIEPGFAPAWTDLGLLYLFRGVPWYGESAGGALVREAIQQALVADPQYGRAYALLARFESGIEWDFTAAEEHAQQALALGPGDAVVVRQAAWIKFTVGRIDEAIDLSPRAIALDPASWVAYLNTAYILYSAHRLEEAADLAQTALSLNPTGNWARYLPAIVLLAQGDAPAALVQIGQEPGDAMRLHGTAVVQHALGDAEASDAALLALIECCAAEAAIQVAAVYAYRDEMDYAFDWLDQAYDRRAWSEMRPAFLRNPWFANLHGDPRWTAFLDKMGLPH